MKIVAFLLIITSAQAAELSVQSAIDIVNEFAYSLNSPMYTLRNAAQWHFGNSVRTFTEQLRQFNLEANNAAYVVLSPFGSEGGVQLQECLYQIREKTEEVLNFLRNSASSRIFDYTNSMTSFIEMIVGDQLEQIRSALASKTDTKCLSTLGLSRKSLDKAYIDLTRSLNSCINSVTLSTTIDIIFKFNPEHFPALSLLDKVTDTLEKCHTRTCLESFMQKYCNGSTVKEIDEVLTSADACMEKASSKMESCIVTAQQTKLPANAPFIDAINKCT